jgi:hypothetical protein
MPRVMNPNNLHQRSSVYRTSTQKVSIGIGLLFIIIGLIGVLMPGFLGMHLSMMHNFMHISSGAFAIWCGYTSSNRSIAYCIGFGAIYGLLGISGYVMGSPGYPGVGNMEVDPNLFRVIPNILELGRMDHVVHILIGSFLLYTAYTFRREKKNNYKNY